MFTPIFGEGSHFDSYFFWNGLGWNHQHPSRGSDSCQVAWARAKMAEDRQKRQKKDIFSAVLASMF